MAHFPRLLLGEAYHANIGLTKHCGGYQVIVHRLTGACERVGRKHHGLLNRHRSQLVAINHITQCIDIGHTGSKRLVDFNRAVVRHINAQRLKPQVCARGNPSSRRQNEIDFH